MFANQEVESVARILAVTILLDKKQRDREMVEFCHLIMTINQELNPDAILPRQKIVDWFDAHKQEFSTALAADTDGSYKVDVLKPITDPKLRQKVLTAIFAVAISDYEFHDVEMDFIKMALEFWKSDMPTLTDVSQMAG